MQHRRVSSNELFSVGYDEERKLLEIEFLNGSVYQYKGVARMIHEELMASNTKSRYYKSFIMNSFPYKKL